MASAHVFGEAVDAVGVLSFGAEVLAGDEPGGALAGAGDLDVGGLLAGLPSAGHDESADGGREIEPIVARIAPKLLDEMGVGAIVAAQILCAFSHPGRIRSEAAFAALGGVAPVPASSGQTVRHRLNRSGDRQLNRALHTIVLCRMRDDARTRAYTARRQAEGRSTREIKRCLKRYTARHWHIARDQLGEERQDPNRIMRLAQRMSNSRLQVPSVAYRERPEATWSPIRDPLCLQRLLPQTMWPSRLPQRDMPERAAGPKR